MSSGYRTQRLTLRAAFVGERRKTQGVASPQVSQASCLFRFYSHASVESRTQLR